MNPVRTSGALARNTWRQRYRSCLSRLLHFKLTLQALALPEDSPEAETLSGADLEAFLLQLLAEVEGFVRRERRLFEALSAKADLRPWRVGLIIPILALGDELVTLVPSSEVSSAVRRTWQAIEADLQPLKARFLQLYVLG